MAMRRAADFRVTIDGTAYAVQRVRVGDHTGTIVVTNTERVPGNAGYTDGSADGEHFEAKIPDIRAGQIQLVNATLDETEDTFGPGGYDLVSGYYYALHVIPTATDLAYYHDYGNCLLVDISHEGGIPGPQPVTLTFETDGSYRLAGEEAPA